jgi:hypothetical protein
MGYEKQYLSFPYPVGNGERTTLGYIGHCDFCGTYAENPKISNPIKWFKKTSNESSDIAYVKYYDFLLQVPP